MKTVTSKFTGFQARPDCKVVKQIQYKRRYWKQSTNSYTWETDWSDLPDQDLVSVSPINWNLDTDILNEFKVSNVTLILNNTLGKFIFDNPFGFFGQDDASPYHTYEPYWTKFKVKVGYDFEDGSDELVTLFTGVSTEFTYDSDNKTVQVIVQGLEATLLNTKAESMATAVSQENAGTGDASEVEFTTANPGVGEVTEVSVAGIKVVEGLDYSISQLNDATLGAKVTFENPPDIGDVIRITYSYWPQGLKLNEIVEELLDAAGVPSGNQEVSDVVFGGSVINSFPFTTEADFESGSLSAIDTTTTPGSILHDMNTSASRQLTTWSTSTSGWSTGFAGAGATFTSDGTYVILNSGPSAFTGRASRASTKNFGSWEFKFKFSSATAPHSFAFYYSATAEHGTVDYNMPGSLYVGASATKFIVHGIEVANITPGTSEHTIKIVKSYFSTDFYYDGTLMYSANGAFNTVSSAYIGILFAGLANQTVSIRDIYIPADTITSDWESPALDFLATPTAWGVLSHDEVLGSGTVTIYTKTSDDDISYDAYVELTGSTPSSTLRRYTKAKVTLSISSSSSITGSSNIFPSLSELTVTGTTDSTSVTLAAFTGSNVYEAIKKVSEFTNYEFGFTPEEVFFFRPKAVGSSILDLTGANYNSKISGMTSGYEKVFGTVRASYGDIVKEVTDTGDFPSSAKAKVLDSRFEITPDSAIQIPPSVDIASGIAQSLYAYLSKRRRRFKLLTKMLPQLDLADVVTITLVNNASSKLWWFGTNSVELGDTSIFLWGEKEQLAFNMPAKIIGARYDIERHNCEFDLEEVVT